MPGPVAQFRAVPRSKVYTDIVEQIMENIRAGTFPPGRALPPERILAERLQVSRSTLREAVRVLEHAGVLDVRGGSGTYVTEQGGSEAATLRARTALLGEYSPLDLIVARSAVEPVAADLAAQSRYVKELTAMERILERHQECISGGTDSSDADADFHLAVATASHNDVLVDLEKYFLELMHERTWTDLKRKSRSRNNELFLKQHAAIFEAIRQKDAVAARTLMSDHLLSVQRDLIIEVSPDSSRGRKKN